MTVSAIRERNARVQILIGEIVVESAVILVSATAHGEIEHPPAHLAILGREITRLHRYFLHRFHRYLGLMWTSRLNRVIRFHSLHANGFRVSGSAVDADEKRDAADGERRARRKIDEHIRIAHIAGA